MASFHFHNPSLAALQLGFPCRRAHVDAVARLLDAHRTLALRPLHTGLYPASDSDAAHGAGYRSVWVRDNVYVALALLETGNPERAARVGDRLTQFLLASRRRFDDVISGRADRGDVRARPHVRFDGERLVELAGDWSHAQNDALGYCLWLLARLARAGALPLAQERLEVVDLLTRFFAAIAFWEDEDSGHWEETRKVSASSIGVVVGGLRASLDELQRLHTSGNRQHQPLIELTTRLLDEGSRALAAMLPDECIQPSPLQNRRYDAALTFLAYPLGVLDGAAQTLVIEDVTRFLMGPIGIRRYLRDSYWAPDYERLSEADRTRDYSNDVWVRDAMIEDVGQEAQWCIFDPALSAYFGTRFAEGGNPSDRERQLLHFNRSLAHITAEWKCPELFYLSDGRWVPNPHTPLLWTQANLLLALQVLRATSPG
ncbi:MAG TPA: glycoside hydrolase family 15 protein [Vicinamibacterales bacterium]|nr:glycoside hydrolase family 15 protein [Vicinamibacterales bacterium]